MDELDSDLILSFGISARTGRPLAGFSDPAIETKFRREDSVAPDLLATVNRSGLRTNANYVAAGVDAHDLSQTGWGVLYAPGIDTKIKEALSPLLNHRKSQSSPLYVTYEGDDSYMPEESASHWVERQGARMDVVNPEKGVPYYLLIVAPPEVVPFEFQYSLDIYWAVGRLWFDTLDEFRRYAESVVEYETKAAPQTSRDIALFATEHDFDRPTQLFTQQVVRPLIDGEDRVSVPIGDKEKFGRKLFLGDMAKKQTLGDLLCGKFGRVPSLLFSGTHGMQFELGDPGQTANQGAIVCQDWKSYGRIGEEDWFAASDVPQDARVHGLIHVFFACHGAGCSEFDNFDELNNEPRRIARKPFLSALPEKLLAHENGGALAVFAHVERAWAYSFQGSKGNPQSQGLRDVIDRLLRGDRIGEATDGFNIRWSAISTDLSDLQRTSGVSTKTLRKLWIQRDDARNFVVLGDPAVRLKTEALTKTCGTQEFHPAPI